MQCKVPGNPDSQKFTPANILKITPRWDEDAIFETFAFQVQLEIKFQFPEEKKPELCQVICVSKLAGDKVYTGNKTSNNNNKGIKPYFW